MLLAYGDEGFFPTIFAGCAVCHIKQAVLSLTRENFPRNLENERGKNSLIL
jgi:hypothetical protein